MPRPSCHPPHSDPSSPPATPSARSRSYKPLQCAKASSGPRANGCGVNCWCPGVLWLPIPPPPVFKRKRLRLEAEPLGGFRFGDFRFGKTYLKHMENTWNDGPKLKSVMNKLWTRASSPSSSNCFFQLQKSFEATRKYPEILPGWIGGFAGSFMQRVLPKLSFMVSLDNRSPWLRSNNMLSSFPTPALPALFSCKYASYPFLQTDWWPRIDMEFQASKLSAKTLSLLNHQSPKPAWQTANRLHTHCIILVRS